MHPPTQKTPTKSRERGRKTSQVVLTIHPPEVKGQNDDAEGSNEVAATAAIDPSPIPAANKSAKSSKGKNSAKQSNTTRKQEELLCTCDKGDDGSPMVWCEECSVWYHFDCVNLRPEDAEELDIFVCPSCAERTGKRTTMKWEDDDYFEQEGAETGSKSSPAHRSHSRSSSTDEGGSRSGSGSKKAAVAASTTTATTTTTMTKKKKKKGGAHTLSSTTTTTTAASKMKNEKNEKKKAKVGQKPKLDAAALAAAMAVLSDEENDDEESEDEYVDAADDDDDDDDDEGDGPRGGSAGDHDEGGGEQRRGPSSSNRRRSRTAATKKGHQRHRSTTDDATSTSSRLHQQHQNQNQHQHQQHQHQHQHQHPNDPAGGRGTLSGNDDSDNDAASESDASGSAAAGARSKRRGLTRRHPPLPSGAHAHTHAHELHTHRRRLVRKSEGTGDGDDDDDVDEAGAATAVASAAAMGSASAGTKRKASLSASASASATGDHHHHGQQGTAQPQSKKRRTTGELHAPHKGRDRSLSMDTTGDGPGGAAGDPARGYCLGKLEETFKDVFLRYPLVMGRRKRRVKIEKIEKKEEEGEGEGGEGAKKHAEGGGEGDDDEEKMKVEAQHQHQHQHQQDDALPVDAAKEADENTREAADAKGGEGEKRDAREEEVGEQPEADGPASPKAEPPVEAEAQAQALVHEQQQQQERADVEMESVELVENVVVERSDEVMAEVSKPAEAAEPETVKSEAKGEGEGEETQEAAAAASTTEEAVADEKATGSSLSNKETAPIEVDNVEAPTNEKSIANDVTDPNKVADEVAVTITEEAPKGVEPLAKSEELVPASDPKTEEELKGEESEYEEIEEGELTLIEKKPEELTEDERALVVDKSKQFARELEHCMYDIYSETDRNGNPSAGAKYRDRFRMIQFNLSQPDRVVIHRRIASASITAKEISVMSSTELANEETQQSIKTLEQESLEYSILKKTFTTPRAKLTHKGLQDIEVDNGMVGSSVGGGGDEGLDTDVRDQKELEDEERRERERRERIRAAGLQRQRAGSLSAPPESPTIPQSANTPTSPTSWGAPPPIPAHVLAAHHAAQQQQQQQHSPHHEHHHHHHHIYSDRPLFVHTSSDYSSVSNALNSEPELNLADLINIDEEGDPAFTGPTLDSMGLGLDEGSNMSMSPPNSALPPDSPMTDSGTPTVSGAGAAGGGGNATGISPFAPSAQRVTGSSSSTGFDLNALWSAQSAPSAAPTAASSASASASHETEKKDENESGNKPEITLSPESVSPRAPPSPPLLSSHSQHADDGADDLKDILMDHDDDGIGRRSGGLVDQDFDMFLEDRDGNDYFARATMGINPAEFGLGEIGDAGKKEGGNKDKEKDEEKEFEKLPAVWNGKIVMPLDPEAKETVVIGRQIGGRMLPHESPLWRTLFPHEFVKIDGRVPVAESCKFLLQMSMNSSKELVAVAFAAVPGDTGLKDLSGYLRGKGRHALVFPWGSRPKEYHPGRELYLVPLLASEPIPDYMELLEDLRLPKKRETDYIVGIWILNKGKLAILPHHAQQAAYQPFHPPPHPPLHLPPHLQHGPVPSAPLGPPSFATPPPPPNPLAGLSLPPEVLAKLNLAALNLPALLVQSQSPPGPSSGSAIVTGHQSPSQQQNTQLAAEIANSLSPEQIQTAIRALTSAGITVPPAMGAAGAGGPGGPGIPPPPPPPPVHPGVPGFPPPHMYGPPPPFPPPRMPHPPFPPANSPPQSTWMSGAPPPPPGGPSGPYHSGGPPPFDARGPYGPGGGASPGRDREHSRDKEHDRRDRGDRDRGRRWRGGRNGGGAAGGRGGGRGEGRDYDRDREWERDRSKDRRDGPASPGGSSRAPVDSGWPRRQKGHGEGDGRSPRRW